MQASLVHKNTSRMLFLGKCEGAAGNIFQVNLWQAFSIKCFAGSDFTAGSSQSQVKNYN